MMIDEPLSDELRLWAERALVRTRNDVDGATAVLAEMLRERPELLSGLSAAIVRSAQRAQIWNANDR